MHTLTLVLRLIHIFAGVFWVGAAIFTAFFLMPALATVGPTASTVMAALERRRLMTALPVAALLTIASGMWLFWIAASGAPAMYMQSAVGGTFALGGIAAVTALLLGIMVSRPAFLAAGRLSATLGAVTSTAEREQLTARIDSLRARATSAGKLATVLLLLAVAAMAVARYL